MAPSIFTRHLEELEELQTGTSSFEETTTFTDDDVSTSEPTIEWRRQILEESYSRVKQAKARTVDPAKVYEVGTLLFDEQDGKFGRVKKSAPGYLLVQFIGGGDREYGAEPSTPASGSKAKAAAGDAKKGGAKAKTSKGARRQDIDDINAFIRAHFQEHSNRELARRTGLSEHTIRRKLGEWGLKRAKR